MEYYRIDDRRLPRELAALRQKLSQKVVIPSSKCLSREPDAGNLHVRFDEGEGDDPSGRPLSTLLVKVDKMRIMVCSRPYVSRTSGVGSGEVCPSRGFRFGTQNSKGKAELAPPPVQGSSRLIRRFACEE